MTRRRSWFRPTPLLLAATLLACGGGGGPSGPVSGSLAVAVSGLPGGASASVSVSGPGGFARTLTSSQTLSSLSPGGYSLTASNVSFGGSAYSPTPVSQSVTVSEGDTPVSASVTYETVTSGLTVTIDGLPSGTAADVTVTGPGGFSQTVTATQTFSNLMTGTYTISANSVTSAGTDYGPNPASQTATVVTGSVATASVSYSVVIPGALNLKIDGMYLTQSVQTYAGAVPLVKDRDGYLRVFVTANQGNVAQPAVRVRFYSGINPTPVQTMTITAPGLSTPLSPDESSLSKSWNVAVPGSLIQPNLKILADVDPTNTVVEANEGDNSFPSSGIALALDVHTAPVFSVRFVPVQVAGRVGNVSSANKDQYLTTAMKMHPLAAYDADVRAQYNSSAPALDASTSSTWTQVLSEINTLQTTEGSSRYYYGVVNPNYSSGIAGVGYVQGKSAIGWDKLPTSAPDVAAHEWGHNWGRNHSPCGNPSGVDPNYPQADGSTGAYGLDVATLALKPPTYADVMAYCSPEWISGYTYGGVLSYREAHPDVVTSFSQALQDCLLVWGRIENGQMILEPSFEVVTRPSLPARGGDYSIEGRSADGSRIFSLPFTPADIADVPGDNKQFSFAIPLSSDRAARLASIRFAGRGREVISLSHGALPQPGARVAPIAVRRTSPGTVSLQWDVAAHPMLLVRDAATGQVISFARGGSVQLPAEHQELSVGFSNGVRSSEMRIAVPSR
jgi:hypothetical protein